MDRLSPKGHIWLAAALSPVHTYQILLPFLRQTTFSRFPYKTVHRDKSSKLRSAARLSRRGKNEPLEMQEPIVKKS